MKTEIAKQLQQERKQEQLTDRKERQKELRSPAIRSLRRKLVIEDVAFESHSETHDVRILYPDTLTVEDALRAGIILGGEFMMHSDCACEEFEIDALKNLRVDWRIPNKFTARQVATLTRE